MSLDLSNVNWTFVGLMTLLAFVATLLGNLIAFRKSLRWRNPCRRSLCGWFCRLELLSAQFWTSDSQDDGNGRRAAKPIVSENV